MIQSSLFFLLNSEHQMTISEFCDKLCYLMDVIRDVDTKPPQPSNHMNWDFLHFLIELSSIYP